MQISQEKINHIVEQGLKIVKEKYPTVEYEGSYIWKNQLWISISTSEDLFDDEELEDYLSEVATDLLSKHGILVFFNQDVILLKEEPTLANIKHNIYYLCNILENILEDYEYHQLMSEIAIMLGNKPLGDIKELLEEVEDNAVAGEIFDLINSRYGDFIYQKS